jgi:WD40 repeat protein
MQRNHLFLKLIALASILVLSACGGTPSLLSTVTSDQSPTPLRVTELEQIPTSSRARLATLTPVSTTEIETGPIGPNNARQVMKLANLGKGAILSPPIWTPDGRWMAIPTMAGIYIYDAESLEEQHRIPAGTSFIAFLPDGSLMTANKQGLVDLWNPATGEKILELPGDPEIHHYPVSLSRDGTLLAANWDNEISVWSLESGERLFDLQGSRLEFSPNGELAVVELYGEDQVHLYETRNGSRVNIWKAHLAGFSPAGQLWLVDDGMVRLVDVERDLVTAPFHGSWVNRPSFSPDGSVMALFANGQISLYDPQNGQRVQMLEGNYIRTEGVLFSPDGQTLAGDMYTLHCPTCSEIDGLDRYLVLWRIADGSIITQIERQEQVGWIAYSKNGSQIAAVQTEYVLLLNAADGSVINRIEGFTAQIEGMQISPNGNTLASVHALEPYILRFWDLESGKMIRALQNSPVGGAVVHMELAFSPDSGILAMGGDLWDLAAGERMTDVEQIISAKTSCWSSDVAFAPQGFSLATGCFDGQLDFWAMPEGEHLKRIAEYSSWVEGLAYSLDGDRLAAIYGVPDYLVQVWQLPEGTAFFTLTGGHFTRVAYSPDGRILATVMAKPEYDQYGWPAGFVQLWTATDGVLIRQLDMGDVVSIAFSPDSQILASGSLDGTLRLWQVEEGKLLMETKGHYGSIEQVVFTPDGTWLVSGSYDGTISVWGIPDPSSP